MGIIFSHLLFIFAPSQTKETNRLAYVNKFNSNNSIAMMNKEKKNIRTKEDLFTIIDAKLSLEEKKELMKADPALLHFGFGTWIRNEFIYSGKYSIDELYGAEEGFDFLISSPDVISGMIIDDYIKHLKGR